MHITEFYFIFFILVSVSVSADMLFSISKQLELYHIKSEWLTHEKDIDVENLNNYFACL